MTPLRRTTGTTGAGSRRDFKGRTFPRERRRSKATTSAFLFKAGQHLDGIDADRFDRIAALHNEECRQPKTGNALADAQIIVTFETEMGDRIILEGVDSERDHQPLGIESLNAPASLFQRFRPEAEIAAPPQGIVGIEARSCALARLVGIAEEAGKFLARIAVDRG